METAPFRDADPGASAPVHGLGDLAGVAPRAGVAHGLYRRRRAAAHAHGRRAFLDRTPVATTSCPRPTTSCGLATATTAVIPPPNGAPGPSGCSAPSRRPRRAGRRQWLVDQLGYRVELVASGFQLPVNIAFVPNPRCPTKPALLRHRAARNIKVVKGDGTLGDYATNLLNFDPAGRFPRQRRAGPVRHRRRSHDRRRLRGDAVRRRWPSLSQGGAFSQHQWRADGGHRHRPSSTWRNEPQGQSHYLQPEHRSRRQALRAHGRRLRRQHGPQPLLLPRQGAAHRARRPPLRTTRSTTPPTGSPRRTTSSPTACATRSVVGGAADGQHYSSRTVRASTASRASPAAPTTAGPAPTTACAPWRCTTGIRRRVR